MRMEEYGEESLELLNHFWGNLKEEDMLSAGKTLGVAKDEGMKAAVAVMDDIDLACIYYADATSGVTESDYNAFAKELGYAGDRDGFAAACVDHFESSSSLRPATGAYKKFYTTAGVTSDDIEKVNTELDAPPPPPTKSNDKLELGLLITLNGAMALISDGSTFTANGDYSDEGSGGQLVFNPRIGFEGAYYFAGTNMKGWKAVFGVGLEVPVTGTHYNASDMIDQYPKVGIGAYGMVGIGGTIGSEKAAFDADISAIVGGRYVNNVVLPDPGVVSGFMGFLDLALRLGVKIKAGERAFLIPGFQLIFSPDIPGMTQISFKATNSDVQEVQGRVSPGGGDGFNVNGGFVLRATWK